MPSSYSTNLKIELQATGENSGTWGTITNTNLGTALEQAVVGYGNPSYPSDANLTLTYTDTNAAQAARALVLNVTSAVSLSTTRELVVPTIQKQYIVQNNTTGGQSITVKTSAGTGITVPNGRKAHLYVNGTDVIYMDDYVDINGGAIDGTPVGANSASTGAFSTLSATGNVNFDGGTFTFNDSGADKDFRVEGDTDANLLFSDASTDRIGIGTNTPASKLDVNGTITATAVNTTTLDLTNLEVTNIKAKDGTSAASIADSTGVVSFTANPILSGGTANGVLYLNGSKVATSGSALTYNGSNLINTNGNVSTSGDFRLSNLTFSRVAIGDGGGGFVGGYNITYSGSPIYDSTGVISGVYYSSGGNVQFFAGGSASAGTAAPEAMRLTSTGLGIGTSTPGSYLSGTAKLVAYANANAQNSILVRNDSAGSSASSAIALNASGNTWGIEIGSSAKNSNALTFQLDYGGANSTLMTLNASGNLGLGVTPSAWGGNWKAIDGGTGSAFASFVGGYQTWMFTNAYADGSSSYKYKASSTAGAYQIAGNSHIWQIAPSGTAGNAITFTQAMTLDASGNLALGNTSANGMRLLVSGYSPELYDPTTASAKFAFLPKGSQEIFDISTGATLKAGYANLINISVNDNNGGDGIYYGAVAQSAGNSGSNFVFGRRTGATSWAESARIDSSGNLGIGTTSPYNQLESTKSGGSTIGIANSSSGASILYGKLAFYSTVAAGAYAEYGGQIRSYSGAGIDYGDLRFYTGNGAVADERARITSGGVFCVGTTNAAPGGANVVGIALGGGGYVSATRDSDISAEFNRKTNDGTIVKFQQDGTEEGSISVSGNTVSYNAFAGSHWSQLQDGSKPDILRGTVMESINELCVWPDESNERLPKSKVSDTAGSKKVYGVFMAWDNDWATTNDMYITAVGAFICRVNASVTVQEGDLLESNGDGTARVQADDIIRSSTIGKVTSTVKTHQYADGSYCVPTVLYCG
jgi:hypothetical protein